MKMDPKEASKINILWTEYHEDKSKKGIQGRGLVACLDDTTVACLRAMADHVEGIILPK